MTSMVMAGWVAGMLSSTPLVAEEAGAAAGEKPAKNAARGERIEKSKAQREARHGERMEKWQKHHDETMAKLKERLAANKKLTEAEKQEVVTFFDTQYGENKTFRQKQFDENMKFLDEMAAKTDLNKEQFREAIQAHFAKQHEENKSHRAEQAAERKAEHQKVRGEMKDGAAKP
jgi:hypothetical protein